MQCSSIQGLYARLTGEDLYISLVLWYSRPLCLIDWEGPIYLFGVAVFKASMLN